MQHHTMRRFDEELDKLRTRLIQMGSLVQEQMEFMIRALETQDVPLARIIIERDAKVDAFDNKIEKQCMRIFALQQPVAMDLRLIMSALTINGHLERLGDHAVNVAEKIGLSPLFLEALARTRIIEMGKKAGWMVTEALDALINTDPEIARSVLPMDDDVDRLDRENFQILIGLMQEDSRLVEACSHLLIVTKNLERIADQATNIAEEVVFLVDAHIIKHRGSAREEDSPPPREEPPAPEPEREGN